MGYYPGDPALVAVHTVILYEAVCHDCGWSSGTTASQPEADTWAAAHDCWQRGRE